MEKFEEALAAYNHVIAIDPRDEKALYSKGVVLEHLSRNTEAIHAYNRALDIDPRDKEALFAKGTALENLGKLHESLQCYDQSLSLDNKNVCALIRKGEILEKESNYFDASECYTRALEINPELKEVHEHLSHLEPVLTITCKNVTKNATGWHTVELLFKNSGKAFAYDIALSAHGCEEARIPKTFVIPDGGEKSAIIHILAGPGCTDTVEIHTLYHNKQKEHFVEETLVRLTF
jgi:tetratricopeptide (TPR) repeat protein